MNFYPEEYIVELTLPFTDLNGAAVTPTAVRAVLYDGDGLLINDFGAISFVPADGSKVIVIPAIFNALSGSEVREARVLRVEMDTASGTVSKRFSYIVEAEQTVAVMINSFQGYESAEVLALDYVNLLGWSTADETRRRASLTEAFKRITRIPMKFSPRDDVGNPILSEESRITADYWTLPNIADLWTALPTHFKRALRTAQLLEASEVLTGDTIGRKRRAGIVSETIGESSVTLNKSMVDYGLSSTAYSVLGAYIDNRIIIKRV